MVLWTTTTISLLLLLVTYYGRPPPARLSRTGCPGGTRTMPSAMDISTAAAAVVAFLAAVVAAFQSTRGHETAADKTTTTNVVPAEETTMISRYRNSLLPRRENLSGPMGGDEPAVPHVAKTRIQSPDDFMIRERRTGSFSVILHQKKKRKRKWCCFHFGGTADSRYHSFPR